MTQRIIALLFVSLSAAIIVTLALAGEITYNVMMLVLLTNAFVAAATFLVLYGLKVPWETHPIGRNQMATTACIAMLAGEELFIRVTGLRDWHPYTITVTVLAVGLIMWDRVAILAEEQGWNVRRKIKSKIRRKKA